MDWNINFRENGILEINYTGKFSNDAFLKVFELVILDSRWKPGTSIIADFRDVFFDDINLDDVFISVSMHSQFNEFIGEGKIAAIHSNDNGLRLGQLYEKISSFMVKSKISSFKDYEAAIDWIQ